MELYLHDTLSRSKRPFRPIDPARVRLYVCGPTVYNYAHIGNARPVIVFDQLFRVLRQFYGEHHVVYARNITDVEDKIIDAAARNGETIRDLTERTARIYQDDMLALNTLPPTLEPRATDHIAEMVHMIERLVESGHAYAAEGHVLFAIGSMADYGKLSGRTLDDMRAGARVEVAPYKKDAGDFVLWKPSSDAQPGWDSPWGRGRPGWHIECSAMARKYLGDNFDLHAGGEDLMFPHHENEIAQSEACTHVQFARHWFHVRFLLVEGRKMSKSEGNFFTLRDLLLKGYRASAIRFLLLSVPYRQQLNFTFDGLAAETNAIERLRTFHARLRDGKWAATPVDDTLRTAITKAEQDFVAAINNDLNTAEARAAIFDLLRTINSAADQNKLAQGEVDATLALLAKFDSIFAVLEGGDAHDAELTKKALAWAEAEGRMDQVAPEVLEKFGAGALSDEQIDALVAERTQAKRQRNFARADAIRNELLEKGIVIEDSKDGVRWKRK